MNDHGLPLLPPNGASNCAAPASSEGERPAGHGQSDAAQEGAAEAQGADTSAATRGKSRRLGSGSDGTKPLPGTPPTSQHGALARTLDALQNALHEFERAGGVITIVGDILPGTQTHILRVFIGARSHQVGAQHTATGTRITLDGVPVADIVEEAE